MDRPRRVHSLPARLKRDEVDLPSFAAHGTWNSPNPMRHKKSRRSQNQMSIWELNEALGALNASTSSPAPAAEAPPPVAAAPAAAEEIPSLASLCMFGAPAPESDDVAPAAAAPSEEDTMALLQALVDEEASSTPDFLAAADASADAVGSPDELLAAMGMAVGDDAMEVSPAAADGAVFELLASPECARGPMCSPSPSTSSESAPHALAPLPPPAALAPPPALTPALGAAAGGDKGRNVAERKEWTAAEDECITTSVARHGCKWRVIAAQLPGRSDDAVRNRWNRLKEVARQREAAEAGSSSGGSPPQQTKPPKPPTPSRASSGEGSSKPERVSWSRAEDETILVSVGELGHRWSKIAARLPGRTEHAIRNRYSRLQSLASNGGPGALSVPAGVPAPAPPPPPVQKGVPAEGLSLDAAELSAHAGLGGVEVGGGAGLNVILESSLLEMAPLEMVAPPLPGAQAAF